MNSFSSCSLFVFLRIFFLFIFWLLSFAFTVQHTQNTNSHAAGGIFLYPLVLFSYFEPAIPMIHLPQTYAFDRSASGIGKPAAFRRVVRCFNQPCHRVPPVLYAVQRNTDVWLGSVYLVAFIVQGLRTGYMATYPSLSLSQIM